ncbi:MAG: carboxypeptidase-like regulatory domain-containing protein [Candidatus Rokuibacteriota bacterium]
MATVQGVVRADNGRPIAGALVSVAGKQAKTNARGVFVVTGVPLGRRTLLVTAGGFSQGKLAIELSSGEVEKVALTLRRATPSAPAQTPR